MNHGNMNNTSQKNKVVQSTLFVTVAVSICVILLIQNGASIAGTTAVTDDESLVEKYNHIYGNDDMPDEIKASVIRSMMNAVEIGPAVPPGQAELGREIAEMLRRIEESENATERQELEALLESQTERMLRVGLVPTQWHDEDPEYWDREIRRAMPDLP